MKCRILAVLFLVVIQSAFAVPTFADGTAGPCKSVDIDFMYQHLNLPKQVSIASKVPVNNLCQVVLNINGRYFTTYASDKYVVIGKMYVNHTLSDSAEMALPGNRRKITFSCKLFHHITKTNFIKVRPAMDKSIAFRYKPEGKIKEVVYMITDPLCPYCNVATKKMKEFSDNYHAELRVIFSSVHGTAGDQKAIESVCRGLTLPEYAKDDWKTGDSTKYQCQKGKDVIEKSRAIARQLHIQGVPTFFLQDGTQIVGADIGRLEKAMKK